MKKELRLRNSSINKRWVARLSLATAVIIFVISCAKHSIVSLSLAVEDWSHRTMIYELEKQLANVHFQEDPVGNQMGKPTLNPDGSLLAKGNKAMVACDVPLCSTMGKNIMLRGGNAADAAITVSLCVGSVNLHSSGIGGGGYIVSSKDNDTIAIEAREMAPAKAHKDMFSDSPLKAMFGGLAVAIPGEVAGLYQLYLRHGSGNLSWKELIEPVIQLNRKGWSAELIWVDSVHKMHDLILSRCPLLREKWDFIFKDGGNKLVEQGDIITRPNYAKTLEKIAKNGSHAILYDPKGPFAPRLAKSAAQVGGILEAEDFSKYEVKVSQALSFKFLVNSEEYELFTTAGVSSGLALIAGLNFYSTLNSRMPIEETHHVLQQHRLIEAMKWTSSARSHLGDTNGTYWHKVKDRYTSSKWANSIIDEGKYCDNRTFDWKHYGPLFEAAGKHGTSHFSVVDEHDNSVSMTTTVNLLFGSMVYDNETGIILNDQMDDFSLLRHSNAFNLTPSVLNFVQPLCRPLSLMAPTIIKRKGRTDLLIGAAGGSRIVTTVLQAIVRNLFHKLNLLNVIAFPRIHHQLIPAFVMVENCTMYDQEFSAKSSVQHELASLKHNFFESGALTAMNAIKNADGVWHGVSDYWRKHGKADGY